MTNEDFVNLNGNLILCYPSKRFQESACEIANFLAIVTNVTCA